MDALSLSSDKLSNVSGHLVHTTSRHSRAHLRERIVIAARHSFLQLGMEGTSMRQIARDVGTSVSTVCYHFSSKDEIFVATVKPTIDTLIAEAERYVLGASTFEERVLWLVGRLTSCAADERDALTLCAREFLRNADHVCSLVPQTVEQALSILRVLLKQAYEEQRVAADVHPAVAIACIASAILSQYWVERHSTFASALGLSDMREFVFPAPEHDLLLLRRVLAGLAEPVPR